MSDTATQKKAHRDPIIVIMGHIDHGKSTLLDYIRKTNVVATESGGITQHISAYEAMHKNEAGEKKRIVFLDTPGHAAFSSMRGRGAKVADIAILVVSAEDGVKEQTMEAHKAIEEAGIPYIIAINKIDRPEADVEKTKGSLAEHGMYVEGYGGDISFVPISAKEGTGVSELLEMMLLTAELEELSGDSSVPAEGVIIESNIDPRKGISGTIVVTNGTLKKGQFVVAGPSLSPVRLIENFAGKTVDEAAPSTPVKVTGFSAVPPTGSTIEVFDKKKDAEAAAKRNSEMLAKCMTNGNTDAEVVIPLVIKADALGTLEAVQKELEKVTHDNVCLQIIHAEVGDIGENDVTIASGSSDSIIIGFRVKADGKVLHAVESLGISIETFAIIYNITDYLIDIVKKRAPKKEVEEHVGAVKILKTFSRVKDKQVIGGRVKAGYIMPKHEVLIERRETVIGRGLVTELQEQRTKVGRSNEGSECGMLVEAKTEIAEGDLIIPIEKKIVQ
ncbi:MAG: translation initiation factor IF-2 [Parcubacteria group bacterium]|nr:translation initiation factor IF-2 [Parcubacteria group bacterium]